MIFIVSLHKFQKKLIIIEEKRYIVLLFFETRKIIIIGYVLKTFSDILFNYNPL